MISTYIVGEYKPTDKTVEVTYFNEINFIHKRIINIPHLQDGSIDENYFQEILCNQLKGLENKCKMNLIEFQDPNQIVGIAST